MNCKGIVFLFFVLVFGSVFSQDSIIATLNNQTETLQKLKLNDKTDTLLVAKFETNFQKKYKTADFDYTDKIPKKTLGDRFLEWLQYWISRIFETSNPEQTASYALIFVRILSAIVISLAIYFIGKIILKNQGGWIFGKNNPQFIEFDELEKNLKNIDFKKLIDQTAATGNYRLEIRYYYLWVLKNLSDKGLIDFNPEKTNSDYYHEIQSVQTKSDFKYASYLYNNIWYGEYVIDINGYEIAKQSFVKLIESF